MKIAIFSDENLDVSNGIDQIISQYSEQSPEILFPVKANQDDFSQSVIRKCLENRVKVTVYFKDAENLEHIIKQVDSTVVCDEPIQEVLRQLDQNSAVGMVWTDSMQNHLILHTVEDLALDIWDITEQLDPIEVDDDPFFGMDSNELHDVVHKALEVFADSMAAYIAATVMDSLGQAVAEHLTTQMRKKDISPFADQE